MSIFQIYATFQNLHRGFILNDENCSSFKNLKRVKTLNVSKKAKLKSLLRRACPNGMACMDPLIVAYLCQL
jgi:hypothetical protein